MKKLLLALPFVATASWAGTTLYSGAQTRDAYDALLAQLDDVTTLAVASESFTSGFARSHAVTVVRTSNGPDGAVLFRLHHDIDHSPFSLDDGEARIGAARIVTTLLTDADPGEETATLLAGFGGEEPLVLRSDVGFDRRTQSVLRIAPFALDSDEAAVSIGGAHYDIAFDPDGRLSASGALGAVTVRDGQRSLATEITLAPSTDSWAFDVRSKGIYTGTQRIDFGDIAITYPDHDAAFRLLGASLDTSASLDGTRMGSDATFAVDELDTPMPLPLNAFSFTTRLGGLDIGELSERFDEINALYAFEPDVDDPATTFAMLGDVYGAMIAPGFSLDYAVMLRNAGGEVNASAGLVFEGDGSPSGHDAIRSVGELVRALSLTASLEADADAVAMTPAAMMLADDALAPWIVSDGIAYRSDIAVDDLIVDINGMPLSLELMLGDLLAMPLDASLLTMLPNENG